MINVTTLIKIQEKHQRACDKHSWSGYTITDMCKALNSELLEMSQAQERKQIHGPHGLIDEAYDTIAVLVRMVEELEAMPDAHN